MANALYKFMSLTYTKTTFCYDKINHTSTSWQKPIWRGSLYLQIRQEKTKSFALQEGHYFGHEDNIILEEDAKLTSIFSK